MFDNLVNTQFKLKYIITLTLELFPLHFWLYLELAGRGGELLISYRLNTVLKSLDNYITI